MKIIATLEKPKIVVADNFITDLACKKLINLASNRLERSKVDGKKRLEIQHYRTSSSVFLETSETLEVRGLDDQVEALTGYNQSLFECTQIAKYEPGQEYIPHFDFGKRTKGKPYRVATVIVYLNEVKSGGGTSFDNLNEMVVYPKTGRCLYFNYDYRDTNTRKKTLHAGQPVITGVKWIAVKWILSQIPPQ